MVASTSKISILLLIFLLTTTILIHKSMSTNHSMVCCNEKDRWILLSFKQDVIDPFNNRLSTWSSEEDCCAWKGVQCDNTTGRVTKLDLKAQTHDRYQSEPLQGKINLSLLQLEFLNSLDLSFNDFEAISIPPEGDKQKVTLATNLHSLDLSYNNDLSVDNLRWLSPLSSLKYLDLSFIDLHKETNWLQILAMFPSLSELRLSGCKLTNISPSLKKVNFTTSLVTIDLSKNNFGSELPFWLFNLGQDISHLDLRLSSFHGLIPRSLLNLRNLRYLDLSWNQLKGSIPDWLGQLEHLQYLYLSGNLFCGSIPSTFGNLSSLLDLRMGYGSNCSSGVLSEATFAKLYNLKTLKLSSSNFAFDFDLDWVPPFQLRGLYLANTSQGPNFPPWIYTQKSLEILDLSCSGISFVDEDIFWSFAGGIKHLYLSNNNIGGDISNVMFNSLSLMLYNNNLMGGLPHISENASSVDLSQNSFTGAIPNGWKNCKYLKYINLRSNKLSGEVPFDLSNLEGLEFVNLEKNEFSGSIPIKMPQNLEVVILRSNQFVGNIPPQLCNLSLLFHLDLAHNELSGSIPGCIDGISNMAMGDASKRRHKLYTFTLFTKGQEYEYTYTGLSRTIDLSSNNLSGEIPSKLFKLIKVQTLNLSHNHFIGRIPKTIRDMESLESLDLSYNKFFGEIPQSMTVLTFLSYMNLSYNNFTGQIPFGTQLQSFDASCYIGNPELCGAPLAINCLEKENSKNSKQHAGNDDNLERESLYLGMGVGFAVGLWGLGASLLLNKAWRHTYYRFLDWVLNQL